MTAQELIETICADAFRPPYDDNPHDVHCVSDDPEIPPGWYFRFGSFSGGFCRIGPFETQQIAHGMAATFWASAEQDLKHRVWQ